MAPTATRPRTRTGVSPRAIFFLATRWWRSAPADELFRHRATFHRRGTLQSAGGVELWEVRMTITLFDPRTGKPVTITVPDRPSLQ